jgi:acyl-CoA-binding protein
MAEALPEYPDSDFSDEEQSPLDVAFTKAADHLRKITNKLNNNQLLDLYGLFKQGTEGKCNIPKPGWLDGRNRKKWEAWRVHGDMPQEEAKQKYVDLLQKLDQDWSELQQSNTTGPKEMWVAVSSLRHSPEPELVPGELTLLEAAREDCGDRITELLSQNPQLKQEKDDDGLSALHWAADRDATKALTALINGGCPLDAVDESGQTALHYAASCGHIKSTQILLKAGASILKDEDGSTPMDVATDDEVRKVLESAM